MKMLKFISGLLRTRQQFTSKLANLFRGKQKLDAETLSELETILLNADVGFATTESIIQYLTKQKINPEQAEAAIQDYLTSLLEPCVAPLVIQNKPFVILMIGINGAGKTTTIGKIAKQLQSQGKSVMLAAGDTFRAAAIEQLDAWGQRNNIPVISQHTGADSASVVFDALQSTQAKNIDVLLADTAGRLHTNDNLLEELKKVKRVMHKLDPNAPHETMLVLDASIGQNGLQQALKFHESLGVTGLAITKLDGTAKGGIIFAIAEQLKLPIRYVGIGEGIDDLIPFDAKTFVEDLFVKD